MATSAPNSPRANSRVIHGIASSTISLPAILNNEPRDSAPVSETTRRNNGLSVRPKSHNDNDISKIDRPLRFTGTGSFWKPSDEAAQRLKASNWGRWSDKGDGKVSKRRLSSFTAPVQEVQEETYPYRGDPTVLLPQRYPFDQPTTDDGTSSISDGSSSGLSRHASSVASVRRMRSLKATDVPIMEMPKVQPESLAQRIARDERQSKTAVQLRKLQNDEEKRLAQLQEADEKPPVPNPGAIIPVPSMTSRSSSRRTSVASSRLPSQPRAAHNPPVTSPSANDDLIQIMDDLWVAATSTSSYWTDLGELKSIRINDLPELKTSEPTGSLFISGQPTSNLHTQIPKAQTPYGKSSNAARSPPIAALPPNPIFLTPEPNSASLSAPPPQEPDNNDLFAELNALVSALPTRSRTTIASTTLIAPQPSKRSPSPLQPASSASSLHPAKTPASDCSELPTPPPAIELSASPSVCCRPPRRDVHQLYRRTRQHSDLGVYNTLPHEGYPLLPKDTCAELPARAYESDRRDLYSWDSVSVSGVVEEVVAPDWNPMTGQGAGSD
ncbi:hypothetical protein MMC17_000023 [Xylographa soralifera]|nr:hypothetical protein [Xylographa soralifera]